MNAFTTKDHAAEARERLRAFWDGSSLGRPALHIVVRDPAAVDPALPEDPEARKALERTPGWHRAAHGPAGDPEAWLAEAMPGHHVVWGALLATLPVFAGGDYHFHGDTAWIKPRPDVLDQEPPTFDPEGPANRMLEACYDATVAAVGTRGFVSPPLMMDGLTTLAAFRGQAQLCLDMMERPDDVKRWAAALNTLYIDIYEHYYRRIGAGASLCFFGPMAEGRTEGVQCDFAVMLSEAMFRAFVLPDLRRVTDYMDRALYHLDGVGQMRFLDAIQECPGIRGIQWNPETDYGRPSRHLDALREIRRRGLCLYVHCDTVEQAVVATRALGPDGLLLKLPPFGSRETAEAAITRIATEARRCAGSAQRRGSQGASAVTLREGDAIIAGPRGRSTSRDAAGRGVCT